MGVYSFTLAGSNYFAPVICGFIAQGQGWQWVFYWPAIFLAVTFVFLFFFMEETNYNRKTAGVVSVPVSPPPEKALDMDQEKADPTTSRTVSVEQGTATKTYAQRLSLWQPSPGQNMLKRATRSLKYLGWPVIAYCGFSYGSYLILFNILNATASIILGGAPYNFSASMVGLCYLCKFCLSNHRQQGIC